jgi:uncharacterized protein
MVTLCQPYRSGTGAERLGDSDAGHYAPSMDIEWDPDKADSNLEKHGVPFDEAATAFGDPLSLTIADLDHSDGEERFVLLGQSFAGRLVVMIHTYRGESDSSALESLPGMRGDPMKSDDQDDADMRAEYDFSDGVRGRYADRFAEGSNVVVLDPDVAAEFKTRKAVNDALRAQLKNGRRASGDDR